jgi:hypothetical protein
MLAPPILQQARFQEKTPRETANTHHNKKQSDPPTLSL